MKPLSQKTTQSSHLGEPGAEVLVERHEAAPAATMGDLQRGHRWTSTLMLNETPVAKTIQGNHLLEPCAKVLVERRGLQRGHRRTSTLIWTKPLSQKTLQSTPPAKSWRWSVAGTARDISSSAPGWSVDGANKNVNNLLNEPLGSCTNAEPIAGYP